MLLYDLVFLVGYFTRTGIQVGNIYLYGSIRNVPDEKTKKMPNYIHIIYLIFYDEQNNVR